MYAKFFRSTPGGSAAGAVSKGGPNEFQSLKIRQFHRGTAVVFTVVVASSSPSWEREEPLFWVYYLPLLPLALLLLSGLYMFALPYAAKRRKAQEKLQ